MPTLSRIRKEMAADSVYWYEGYPKLSSCGGARIRDPTHARPSCPYTLARKVRWGPPGETKAETPRRGSYTRGPLRDGTILSYEG